MPLNCVSIRINMPIQNATTEAITGINNAKKKFILFMVNWIVK